MSPVRTKDADANPKLNINPPNQLRAGFPSNRAFGFGDLHPVMASSTFHGAGPILALLARLSIGGTDGLAPSLLGHSPTKLLNISFDPIPHHESFRRREWRKQRPPSAHE